MLHPQNLFIAEQRVGALGVQLDAGKLRNVIQNHRNRNGVQHSTVVGDNLLAAIFVVVGRHQRHRAGAVLLGVLRQLDGIPGARRPDVSDHRHATARRLHQRRQHLPALIETQQRPLPGGAAAVKALNPARQLGAGESVQRRVVHRLIGVHRRHHGGDNAAKNLPFIAYHAVQPPSTTTLEPVI